MGKILAFLIFPTDFTNALTIPDLALIIFLLEQTIYFL